MGKLKSKRAPQILVEPDADYYARPSPPAPPRDLPVQGHHSRPSLEARAEVIRGPVLVRPPPPPRYSAADMYRPQEQFAPSHHEQQFNPTEWVGYPPQARDSQPSHRRQPSAPIPQTSNQLAPTPPHKRTSHYHHGQSDQRRSLDSRLPAPTVETAMSRAPPQMNVNTTAENQETELPYATSPIRASLDDRIPSANARARTFSQDTRGAHPRSDTFPAGNIPFRPRYLNSEDPYSVNSPVRNNSNALTPVRSNRSTSSSHSTRQYTHACLSMSRADRIRMIKFPQTVNAAIKSAVERSWTRGIQHERDSDGAYELQFKGNPWSGQGDEAIFARVTMCEILSAVYHYGWNLVMATDISKKAQDKDLLIFREGAIPPPCQFMAISFDEGDRIRLISGGSGGLGNEVINAVKMVWGQTIQREMWRLEGIAWEYKINGNPWGASGDESIQTRVLLLSMLDTLTNLGWELHASLDMTAGPGGATRNAGSDTDCWIMRKQSN